MKTTICLLVMALVGCERNMESQKLDVAGTEIEFEYPMGEGGILKIKISQS